MRYQELYDTPHKVPFQSVRIQFSNGQSQLIRHPDFGWLMRNSVFIGLPSGDDEVPDRAIQCDLLHVVAIEPVNGAKGSASGKRRKRPPE